MAVVWELRGREFSFGEGKAEDVLQYLVTAAADEATAVAAIKAVVPATFNGLWFITTRAREVGKDTWLGTANYGIPTGGSTAPGQGGVSPPPPPPPLPAPTAPLGPEWSFDTTGGTQHITMSKQTRQAEKGLGFTTAPDTQLIIGASKTGEPAGCDITVPKFEFSTTRKMDFMTLNYMWTLVNLTGKTNNATFLSVFPAASVLYLGAAAQYRDDGGWSVTHRFSAAPNRTGNPAATNPVERLSPNGHDYVWATYQEVISNDARVQVPASAFVERVYDSGDFGDLKI